MFIKKIHIHNFRQLTNTELNLEEKISILAGPNNSGKTSVLFLLKRILADKNFNLKSYDYNVYHKTKWLKNFIELLMKSDIQNEDGLEKIRLNINDTPNELLLPEIKMEMEIEYSDSDDLTNFAKYLLDLDEDKHSFYFQYKVVVNVDNFLADLKSCEQFITEAINELKTKDTILNENSSKYLALSKKIMQVYCKNADTFIYYCDALYDNKFKINDQREFHNLFNFMYIPAARLTENDADNDHTLSSGLVSFAKNDIAWNERMEIMSQEIYNAVTNSIDGLSVDSSRTLENIMSEVSKANGGHVGEISLDVDASEKDLQQLVSNTTYAKYTIKSTEGSEDLKYVLNENSQGLGYSNLIYLDTKIEAFIRERETEKNQQKVNILIVEEPESHMHPHMQYVFANYLVSRYDNSRLQGIITTHSTEIVRGADFNSLRILRKKTMFDSKLCDLNKVFEKENQLRDTGNNMDNSIKSFFRLIGIADLIFADRAILFEGDTERLYLHHLINTRDEFKELRQKYVAYVQVGGEYAFKLDTILEELGVKTLIISDVDYCKSVDSEQKLMDSDTHTENSTINHFYKKVTGEKNKAPLSKVYEWLDKDEADRPIGKVVHSEVNIKLNNKKEEKDLILLTCQTKEDQYSRTLEAAMLSKYFRLKPFQKFRKEDLQKMKEDSKLKFGIPRKNKNFYTLIDVLDATSGGKTDFMYSVIVNEQAYNMLPHYIEEGLKWLQK